MKLRQLVPILLVFAVVIISTATLASAAPNAIDNWCATDPVGNAACAANVDKPTWINPGYRWHVFFNTGGQSMCMQYSTNSGANWTQTTCQFVGDNSTYEDCGDNNSGNGNCRDDHWICEISSNIISTNNIMFQFYRDSGSCDSDFSGTSEWSSQPTFSTGTNAITLRSLSASVAGAPAALPLLAGVIGLAGLGLGVGAYARRQRR